MTILRLNRSILILTLFSFCNTYAQTYIHGLNEQLINSIPANEFDFAGTWTAYTYSVVYDNEAGEMSSFEPSDTISNVVFNRLVGFPTQAYELTAIDGQNLWSEAVLNLDTDAAAYNAFWLGVDGLKWVATTTTYGELGIQFNIDVPDVKSGYDDNLFIELVRN